MSRSENKDQNVWFKSDEFKSWHFYIPRFLELLYNGKSVYRETSTRVFKRLTGQKIPETIGNETIRRLADHGAAVCHSSNPDCGSCQIRRLCEFWRSIEENKVTAGLPFIDVFCGAGGLSIGLEHSGFKPILAVDSDSASCSTYLFNRPYLNSEKVRNDELSSVIEQNSIPSVPLVVGGPPCQGFSNANRQRLSRDPRNKLYKQFVDTIRLSHAKFSLMENVPGIMKSRAGIELDFEDIGFQIQPVKINALDFSYPQNRNRVFILGVRTRDMFLFHQIANHFQYLINLKVSNKNKPSYKLFDAIGDLPRLEAKNVANSTWLENEKFGYTVTTANGTRNKYTDMINNGKKTNFLFNHRTKYNNPRDIMIYSRLQQGEKSDAESISTIMPYKNRSHIFKDKFYKLVYDDISKAVTAHMYYDCHMYIHPAQARGLTPREAARIQGFPDDYLFMGYPNEWYRQIGNAVSPLVANHIGAALSKIIDEYGDRIV